MNEIAVFAIEHIADIGIVALSEKVKDERVFAPARDLLKTYLKRQEKLNYFCERNEEIDFGGLSQYIQSELAEDMALRLFGDDSERTEANGRIIEKAKSFASAHTQLSEKRAVKLVSETMKILRAYYRKGISRELRFIEGEIIEHLDQKITETKIHIDQSISEAKNAIIETVQSTPFSLDANMALAHNNRFDELEQNLILQEKALNATHKLAPFYGYRLEENKRLVSIPLLKEATALYPPGFQMSIKNVRIGDKEANRIDESTFAYSYRHQTPIQFDVISATKKLGGFLDPIQTEAKEMEGAHVYVYPHQFPPARAYALYVDDEIFFDYLLMRTKDIQEDGTAIITNCEQQNASYAVSFSLNSNKNDFSINIKVVDNDNKTSLKYRQFLKALSAGGKLIVKDLESGAFLVNGYPTSGEKTDAAMLEREIDLLSKVISIEDYIGVSICIPETITVGDYGQIEHIHTLITGNEYVGSWKEFDIGLEFAEETRERILEMESNMYMFMICQLVNVSLFDTTFTLPIKREYYDARVKDLDKLKDKVQLLEKGEIFKIKLYSDDETGSKYIDKLTEDEFGEDIF